jgi:tripartite-type tricarboxylate transporter receptor subunit TctC
MANETQVLFGSFPSTLPKIQDGSLKALAVTGPKRSSTLPDLPTMEESGYPGFIVTSWYVFMAPAGTPKPVIDKLGAAAAAALAKEDVKKKIEATGQDIQSGDAAMLASLIKQDIARWRKVLNDAGIQPE